VSAAEQVVLEKRRPASDFTQWPAAAWRAASRHHGLVALVIYAALAAFWDRSSLAHLGSVCPCGLPGDPAQYAWGFVWFPHALFNGLSLLHTRAMWAPTGINLAGATATPLLAFVFAPVTWLWGPRVAIDLAWILAPITAAWSAYWLCRYVTRAPWAALLGGLAYGFGTFEVAHLDGHLHLVMIFCPPLVALSVLQFLHARISRRRLCGQLLVLLLIQFGISVEVLFTMSVLGVVGLALGWVFAGPELRGRIRATVVPIVIAYAGLAVLMSWYIVALLHANAYATGKGVRFPTDLLSIVTPEQYTWIGGQRFTSVTNRFIADRSELNAYIGLPLLLIVVYQLARRWRRRESKWFAAMLVIALFWVLGSHLYVDGHESIWLPYSLFAKLPGFDQVLQGRVAAYLGLMCAVLLALWVADSERQSAARWLAGLAAVAFVLPNLASPGPRHAGAWHSPAFFSTGIYKHYLTKGETVLPIRWGWLSESPLWQAETHMYFNLASGYFTTVIPPAWRSPLTNDLWSNHPVVKNAYLLRGFVADRHVSDIIVQRADIHRWSPVLRAAGLHPTATVGGVAVYHITSTWLRGGSRA